MPIPSDSYQALDETVSRLATESILAQPGRDDGLVPAYSLIGELRELCSMEAALRDPISALHTKFESYLDAAKSFDADLLRELHTLIEWLPSAISAVKDHEPVPSLATAAALIRAAAGLSETGPPRAEELMELHLDENRELLAAFHGEAVEHLQQIEAALLALDQRPDDPEALSSIFRSFHTIKGNAGFLGLMPMQALAHEVESLLDLARNHKLRLNAAIITEILRSRDALQQLTQQVGSALEHGKLPDQIVPVGHLITAVKQLTAITAGDSMEETALSGSSDDELSLSAQIAEVLQASNAPASAQAAAAGPAAKATTVRVNTEKLDSLMDVVGELVIVQGQLMETARQIGGDGLSPLQRNISQLSRITKELQHTAMALRMIPIKPTFQKMERLVRDLARDFGKKVQFVTSGDDTELDRTVVEEIGDPLVHMVRNSLDHGLEPADVRLAAGKPEIGTLNLRAYHQGSNIVVELQDDGRGIDPERVFRKAVEKGIVAADATLTRDEIHNLIFSPGFSTAEVVTAVSGRGVGMDVVKRNIERLRGKIEIISELGVGLTFKIKLPLTMAIIDGLVVRVGTDRFILPTTSVQRALKPLRENISTVHGRGEVLDMRGRLVPIHRLHQRFNIAHDAQNPWDGIMVIVEHSGKTSALFVDEMVSKQEVVIKNMGAFMQNLPGVAGGAILGDGNIALILDPITLLEAA